VPLLGSANIVAWLSLLAQYLNVAKKPLDWWRRRKLQRRVRQVAYVASRGLGGFEDPNVSAVSVAPERVTEIQVNPETKAFDVVQVNRDQDLLLMQSSLYTLRGQFDYLKEYLPLVVVHALEFVLLYSSLVQVSPKSARSLRHAIELTHKTMAGLLLWYDRFEELHTRGNVAGLIIPFLEDVRKRVPVPTRPVRRECTKYIT